MYIQIFRYIIFPVLNVYYFDILKTIPRDATCGVINVWRRIDRWTNKGYLGVANKTQPPNQVLTPYLAIVLINLDLCLHRVV